MNKDASIEPRLVEITREPVELYKVLKFEGLVGSGGEAKAAIEAGLVTVNGTAELQKRKKLVGGDVVRVGDEVLVLSLVEGYVAPTPAEKPKKVVEKKAAPKKDWRKKRTPAEIDAAAGVVSQRGKPFGKPAK
ncbi:MAG: RNA-binding S4 domain-containing protein [Gammaproteobacteria bacterium]|jgi:ribosome-associated protein|nr:RNA-binding S4 domain-containing protein [Gammaproteobacteria bacterium]